MRVWTGLFRLCRTSRKQDILPVVGESATLEHKGGTDAIMHEMG